MLYYPCYVTGHCCPACKIPNHLASPRLKARGRMDLDCKLDVPWSSCDATCAPIVGERVMEIHHAHPKKEVSIAELPGFFRVHHRHDFIFQRTDSRISKIFKKIMRVLSRIFSKLEFWRLELFIHLSKTTFRKSR